MLYRQSRPRHLGISFRTKRPVLTDIAERLPATLELVVAAMILATLNGVGWACWPPPGATAGRSRRQALRFAGLLDPGLLVRVDLLFIFTVKVHWLPRPGAARFPPVLRRS